MSEDVHSLNALEVVSTAVAVVSDDRLFSEGLVRLLSSEPLFTVRVCHVAAQASIDLDDVVLLDSRMETGFALCEHLARDRRMAVLLIAAPDDDAFATKALTAGARGLLSRTAGSRDMIQAIRGVADGVIWAPRRVISAMLDRLVGATREISIDSALEKRLSAREREIFRYAATGLGNKELAARLAISEATVKVHLTHIFQKLGLRGRAELAAAYYGRQQSSASLLSFGRSAAHKPRTTSEKD